jgi:hypothetical protein
MRLQFDHAHTDSRTDPLIDAGSDQVSVFDLQSASEFRFGVIYYPSGQFRRATTSVRQGVDEGRDKEAAVMAPHKPDRRNGFS